MHRHIRVSQHISNLICDPTLDSHTCSLVKCCHFSRVSCSTIQRSSVHLQIAAQRSPSTCTNEINTDTHIDPTQSPRAWYVYPQAFECLELEKLFLRFTLFWTETSDVTPGICSFLLFVKHHYVRLVCQRFIFRSSCLLYNAAYYVIDHLSNLCFVKDVFNASFYVSVLIFFGSQQPLPLIQAVVCTVVLISSINKICYNGLQIWFSLYL